MLINKEILFSETNLLPPIITDLLKQEELNFNKKTDRKLLVSKLKDQYGAFASNEKVQLNIDALINEDTFTVTTGHQLCLLGGPAYFIYKIISTIKACELYASKYPSKKFVPVFWLASEDHDFEEVNHLYLFNKKIQWQKEAGGAVGRLDIEGLKALIDEVKNATGENDITKIFEEALATSNLADFTKYWVNAIFGKYGLVIINADDKELKRSFSSVIEKEFTEKVAKVEVEKTNAVLVEKYKVQVNPREVNFFLLDEKKRERFIEPLGNWKQLLEHSPEKFSPNVIYRPLYQEFVLPNVAYVGGPNELAYWFQLGGVFAAHQIPYPQLILRDSFLVINSNQLKMMRTLNFTEIDVLENVDVLKSRFLYSKMEISDVKYTAALQQLFDDLKQEVSKIDSTLEGTVEAEKAKTVKSLENLFGRIKKSEKARHEVDLNKIEKLKNQLFPDGIFQERRVNFIEFYARFGSTYFDALLQNANPLNSCLKVLEEA